MNYELLIPLFALVLWISALYADNKFRYFYEGKDALSVANSTTGWKKYVIYNNVRLKYAGLGLLWAGFSLGMILSDGRQNIASVVSYGIGIVGLLIYVGSRIWPFLVPDSGSKQ